MCRRGPYSAVKTSVQPHFDQHMVLSQQAISKEISVMMSLVLTYNVLRVYGIHNQWKALWGVTLNGVFKTPGILSYATHKGNNTATACLIGPASYHLLCRLEALIDL